MPYVLDVKSIYHLKDPQALRSRVIVGFGAEPTRSGLRSWLDGTPSHQMSISGDPLCPADARLHEGYVELDPTLREAEIGGPGGASFCGRRSRRSLAGSVARCIVRTTLNGNRTSTRSRTLAQRP